MPANTRPYGSARGAIHSLTKLATLSASAVKLLFVSERTLYILQNWAAEEALYAWRYSVSETPAGYRPVTHVDDEWPLFISVVDRLSDELTEFDAMDIEEILTNILLEIQAHPPLSYESTQAVNVLNTNAAAGANSETIFTVPDSEEWVLQAISAANGTSVSSYIDLRVLDAGGESVILQRTLTPAAGLWVTWTGNVSLRAGCVIGVIFGGCAAGDDLISRCWVARVRD